MDLQNFFVSPTEGWLKWHLWLAGSVYDLARVQQPHAVAPGGKPAEFTIHTHTCSHARLVLLIGLTCACSWYLESPVHVCLPLNALVCYATLVWHLLPVLTSDFIPLYLSNLKCHPTNYSFLTSSCTLSRHSNTSDLWHPLWKSSRQEHIRQLHAMKRLWVISQWEVINHLSFNNTSAM